MTALIDATIEWLANMDPAIMYFITIRHGGMAMHITKIIYFITITV
jgi:hypothetical protein